MWPNVWVNVKDILSIDGDLFVILIQMDWKTLGLKTRNFSFATLQGGKAGNSLKPRTKASPNAETFREVWRQREGNCPGEEPYILPVYTYVPIQYWNTESANLIAFIL